MSCIAGRRIVLTGGGGFLGQAVCRELANHQPAEVHAPRRAEFDLRDRQAIQALLHQSKPDVIIHLAAVVGGIGANRQNPGHFFYENAIMGIELIEQARLCSTHERTFFKKPQTLYLRIIFLHYRQLECQNKQIKEK